MSLKTIACEEALADLGQFDAILDVRSESEFAIDRIPGALSCPVLTDPQRAQIGTLYRHASPFEARRAGAALVASNIALQLRTALAQRPRAWSPLVYCWRGGERSGAMAHVLSRVGWRVRQLEGGYRAFRRSVLDALAALPAPLTFRVLCGATGSGKSRLLAALKQASAQVLDLETLALHRGSLLGALPDRPQPSQKHFETRLWWSLKQFDRARPVFVESESRRIGQCEVPAALLDRMRASECLQLELPMAQRIRLLREDYRHYEGAPEALVQQLSGLTELHGASVVARWSGMARAGQWEALVAALLAEHYDPVYRRSIGNNYLRAATAVRLPIESAATGDFDRAAQVTLRSLWPAPPP